MDLDTALILDLEGDRQYFVQIATKEYCSAKFWEAFRSQTPLTRQDLIEEDRHQLFATLDKIYKDRKDLTKDT
jgi:hypothetical protein